MALKFNWPVIQSLEETLIQTLNEKLAATEKPDFIGDVVIKEISFGNKVPDVEILEIKLKDDPSAGESDSQASAYDLGSKGGRRSRQDLLTAKKAMDIGIQTTVRVLYNGDARFKISTELRVNKPLPNFIVFPVTLAVFNFSFNAQIDIISTTEAVEIICNTLLGHNSSLGPDILNFRVQAELGEDGEKLPQGVENIEKFVLQQLKQILTSRFTIPLNKPTLKIASDPPLQKITSS